MVSFAAGLDPKVLLQRDKMSNLFIEVIQVNESVNYRIGDPQFEETKYSNKNELYRALLKEYGRCIGKQCIDDEPSQLPRQVGWIFEKREFYSDCRTRKSMKSLNSIERESRTFVCQTWISVHKALPTKTIQYHFAQF